MLQLSMRSPSALCYATFQWERQSQKWPGRWSLQRTAGQPGKQGAPGRRRIRPSGSGTRAAGEAGLGGQILSSTNAQAPDLSVIADDSCGAVLMLGPFYNLSLPEERRIRSRGSFGTSTTSYGSSLPNHGTTHRANGDRGRVAPRQDPLFPPDEAATSRAPSRLIAMTADVEQHTSRMVSISWHAK